MPGKVTQDIVLDLSAADGLHRRCSLFSLEAVLALCQTALALQPHPPGMVKGVLSSMSL